MPRRFAAAATALLSLFLQGRSFAEEAAPTSDFSLTIYSTADPAAFDPQHGGNLRPPGFGVVRERRRIDLAAGLNTLKFPDVASGIDPTTVSFKSLTAPDTTAVLEQSYEFDLLNPEALLEKYVGHSVIINRKQAPLQEDKTHQPETIEGKLLAFDANNFVLQTENKRLPVQIIPRTTDINEIKLFELETGLITKPTLAWKLTTDKAGPHDAQVTYQTNGLTWRADYAFVVNADDSKVDVTSWVSVVNESGASFPEAKLKLIAGDVHRLPRDEGAMLFSSRKSPESPPVSEKPLFESHLYTVARPTTLVNNSVKQIELFPPRGGVPVKKVFVYDGLPEPVRLWSAPDPVTDPKFDAQPNTKVGAYLQLINSEKSGLGVPLPAGRIRVYKKDDADAANEFVGEDAIPHTPKDEKILVKLGSAFDLVGDRRLTDFKLDEKGNGLTESFEITLRNRKTEPVSVIVRETLFRWSNWTIPQISEKFEKQDYRTIRIPVEVPAGGEKKVTYQVKYAW